MLFYSYSEQVDLLSRRLNYRHFVGHSKRIPLLGTPGGGSDTKGYCYVLYMVKTKKKIAHIYLVISYQTVEIACKIFQWIGIMQKYAVYR